MRAGHCVGGSAVTGPVRFGQLTDFLTDARGSEGGGSFWQKSPIVVLSRGLPR